ncbi:MAG: 4-alpha-glucanotransferase [Verrucomicrobiota bacterium JB025]|nr:4-alpha-glucanotransferase [Verrucomicrobiota bacterium JB025]
MQASTLNRTAGILIPTFSARREGDFGIGDTLAIRDWIDWAAEHGVGFLQLLPVNENGVEESPYSGISSAALDPIYLALDHSEIPWISQKEIDSARDQLGKSLTSPLVDYPVVRKTKRALLELAWAKFSKAASKYQKEFTDFRESEAGWLDDYCLFRWLMEIHGPQTPWDLWPEECKTPAKARQYLANQRRKAPQATDAAINYFAFAQWLCFRQWRALRAHADRKNVKLMGDIPIGISWHSADVFFDRDEFLLDWCGGSPPEGMGQSDPFFQQWGQNWGIPLYRWDAMQANDFKWWKQRVRRITEIFSIFRLDHILGFYRIYAFPWRPERNHEFIGLSHDHARELTGGQLPHWFLRPDDTDENKAANLADGDVRLRGILKDLDHIEVIAEDLGWVPEYVRPHLEKLGIAGFRIPHWDCNDQGHPTPGDHFPENSFATFSTHDHDPVNGIWRGCFNVIKEHQSHPSERTGWQAHGAHHTLRILSEFAGIPIPHNAPWPPYTEGIRLRLLKALLASNARYALLMVTELFSLDDRINHPGTVGHHNWSFRLPWTVPQINSDPKLREICQKFSNTILLTGRSTLDR